MLYLKYKKKNSNDYADLDFQPDTPPRVHVVPRVKVPVVRKKRTSNKKMK